MRNQRSRSEQTYKHTSLKLKPPLYLDDGKKKDFCTPTITDR